MYIATAITKSKYAIASLGSIPIDDCFPNQDTMLYPQRLYNYMLWPGQGNRFKIIFTTEYTEDTEFRFF